MIYRRRATSAKRSWCDIQEEGYKREEVLVWYTGGGLQARRGLGVIYRRRATSAKRSWCDIQEEGYKREEVLV